MELTRNEFVQQQQQRLTAEGAIADAPKYVKYKIAILSGKDGVGKTAATVNLAAALKKYRSSCRRVRCRPPWPQRSQDARHQEGV